MLIKVKAKDLPNIPVECKFRLGSIRSLVYQTKSGSSRIDELEKSTSAMDYKVTKNLHDLAPILLVNFMEYGDGSHGFAVSIPHVPFNDSDLSGINDEICAIPAVARVRKRLASPWTKCMFRGQSPNVIFGPDTAVFNSSFGVDYCFVFSLNKENEGTLRAWVIENWLDLFASQFAEIGDLYEKSKEAERLLGNAESQEQVGYQYLRSLAARKKLEAAEKDIICPEAITTLSVEVGNMVASDHYAFKRIPDPE